MRMERFWGLGMKISVARLLDQICVDNASIQGKRGPTPQIRVLRLSYDTQRVRTRVVGVAKNT